MILTATDLTSRRTKVWPSCLELEPKVTKVSKSIVLGRLAPRGCPCQDFHHGSQSQGTQDQEQEPFPVNVHILPSSGVFGFLCLLKTIMPQLQLGDFMGCQNPKPFYYLNALYLRSAPFFLLTGEGLYKSLVLFGQRTQGAIVLRSPLVAMLVPESIAEPWLSNVLVVWPWKYHFIFCALLYSFKRQNNSVLCVTKKSLQLMRLLICRFVTNIYNHKNK